jgi:hypothetical protein
VPQLIGTLISANRATLVELQTVLGLRDAYDLIEVLAVDNENKRRALKAQQK